LAFALLTIPAIAIEYGDTGQPWQTIGTVLNWTIWLAFVVEFVVMLWVVPDRWLWIRKNPLDLAIVVLTPPFLPESLQAARVFRLFLLARLAKAGVLVRHLLSTTSNRVSKRVEHSAHPGPWGLWSRRSRVRVPSLTLKNCL
jgi:hypothetical protein